MPKFSVAVSALSTMTARIEVTAKTPERAAVIAAALVENEPVDWEYVDGGRPAPGSAAVDAVCDETDSDVLFEPDASPVAMARDAVAHLVAARDLLKRVGAERTVARVRLALSSAKGAVRHAENRRVV